MSQPILKCPDFSIPFTLYTDASDVGLGDVLQQGNNVIAYSSRTLKPSERNYSVIERECLALVYAVKYFKHYLLGRKFSIYTDHNPLQWLSAQKMEGKLCRRALLLQECEFDIFYRKGSCNTNADALSRQPCALTEIVCGPSEIELHQAQSSDPTIAKVVMQLQKHSGKPTGKEWAERYKRWLQLWPQLVLKNNVLFRRFIQPISRQECIVPVVLPSLRQNYLQQFHDAPLAGHQRYVRTLA
jgi:hypothetical protein